MDASMQENVAFLEQAKQAVIMLEEAKKKREQLSLNEKRLEKLLDSEQKTVEEEVQITIKRRREAIVSGYDKDITAVQDRLKKTKGKKEQAKLAGKEVRVKQETSDLAAENVQIKQKLQTLYKQEKIGKMYQNGLFFCIFMPHAWLEKTIDLLLLLICFFVLPYGTFVSLNLETPLLLSILHLIYFAVFGGVFAVINSQIKYKKLESFKLAQNMRDQERFNKKKIRVISKSIRNDNNEAYYDLSEFNYDIAKLEAELEEVGQKKQEGIQTFDAVTSQVIRDEIQEGSKARILSLKGELTGNQDALALAQEQEQNSSIKLKETYGGYIGQDYMTAAKLDELIRILKNGQAVSITEAITVDRNSKI